MTEDHLLLGLVYWGKFPQQQLKQGWWFYIQDNTIFKKWMLNQQILDMLHVYCSYSENKALSLTAWWRPLWPFQPELYNEVFDDTDGQEGAGKGLTDKVSPRPSLASDRREYMNLAAVPRLSRPSVDLQVPTASTTARAAPSGLWCAWLWPVAVSVLSDTGTQPCCFCQ